MTERAVGVKCREAPEVTDFVQALAEGVGIIEEVFGEASSALTGLIREMSDAVRKVTWGEMRVGWQSHEVCIKEQQGWVYRLSVVGPGERASAIGEFMVPLDGWPVLRGELGEERTREGGKFFLVRARLGSPGELRQEFKELVTLPTSVVVFRVTSWHLRTQASREKLKEVLDFLRGQPGVEINVGEEWRATRQPVGILKRGRKCLKISVIPDFYEEECDDDPDQRAVHRTTQGEGEDIVVRSYFGRKRVEEDWALFMQESKEGQ